MTDEELFEQYYATVVPKHIKAHHDKFGHEGLAMYDKRKDAFLAALKIGKSIGASAMREKCKNSCKEQAIEESDGRDEIYNMAIMSCYSAIERVEV